MVFLQIMLAYLLGSINFSYLLTKLYKKVDVRDYGSGNAGTTNTVRTVGWALGLIVFLLDMLKGFWAATFSDYAFVQALCGAAVVSGHIWPVFLRFRGGKGVATTLGVTLAIFHPIWYLLGALLCGVLIALFTGQVFLGSLISLLLFVGIVIINWSSFWSLALMFFLLAIIFWAHRSNINHYYRGFKR